MKTTDKMMKITDLLKEGIDKYRIVIIEFEYQFTKKIESFEFCPYVLLEDEENVMEIHGFNVKEKFLTNYEINSIRSVEMTDTPFKVDETIEYFLEDSEYFSDTSTILKSIKEVEILNGHDPDDETYRQPCIYCDSKEICDHVLYEWDYYDSMYGDGRIDEVLNLQKVIEVKFHYLLKNNIKIKFKKKEIPDELFDLWNNIVYDTDDNISIDVHLFISFVSYIINNDLGSEDVMTFRFSTGGGVGNDDVVEVCYAIDPVRILQRIEEKINDYLKPFNIVF